MRITENSYQIKYNQRQTFTGLRLQSFKDFMGVTPEEFVKNGNKLVKDCFEKVQQKPINNEKELNAVQRLYQEYLKENEMIFNAALKPDIREIAQKITDLPTYGMHTLPYLVDKKKADLEYLYKLAKEKDILGEMRIPGACFSNFSEIPYERLKMLEPIIMSKNDAGMWNYSPSFIWRLDNKYSDKQIEIMSRLAKYKVNGMNLQQIAQHPHLNHWSIIEKAKNINELFGKDLREIEFFSTSKGENYISIDVQKPHDNNIPDYQNFKRLYAKVGTNEVPQSQPLDVPEIDKYIHNIYTNLEKMLVVFNPEKLDYAIKEVMGKVPRTKEIDVLRVMQKLTQFANYSSLKHIQTELVNNKICEIDLNGGINSVFNYFAKSKSIINLPSQKGESNIGIFVTKDDLKDINFRNCIKDLAKYSDIRFINLEGWSDGINLFNDDNLLARKTISVLKRTFKLMKNNKNYSFNEALDNVLNGKIEKHLSKNGIKVKTISVDAPATRQTILEQMRPIMPSENMLKSTVESVANHYTKNKKKHKKLSIKIAKYYDENFDIYSKQRIIENLKDLKTQVINYAKQKNISKENIYLIIPKTKKEQVKSFDVINKMFSQIIYIPEDRISRINSINNLKFERDNAIFVITDDIAASGYSMSSAGNYTRLGQNLSKNQHILFCPVSATTEGIDYINFNISNRKRADIDKVLHAKNGLRCYDTTADNFIEKHNRTFYSKVFGYDKEDFNSLGMCTSFPYMGPDNNSELAGFLIKYFTPSIKCIKSKSPFISEIEQQAYYYNIFGTDEKHVPTRIKFNDTILDKIKKKIITLIQNI